MLVHPFLKLNFMPPVHLPTSATTTVSAFNAVGFCGCQELGCLYMLKICYCFSSSECFLNSVSTSACYLNQDMDKRLQSKSGNEIAFFSFENIFLFLN